MVLGERLKQLRKELGLTQSAFAERIGSVQNTVTGYESGRRNPSAPVVSLICREFSVNERWLRTGEGEMFAQTTNDPVERLCAELHATKLDAEIIRAYFEIDERIREPFMRQLLEHVKVPVQTISRADEPDIVAELAELKRQNQALAAKIAAMEEEDAAQESTQANAG